jgi:hypothetical protein
MLRQIYTVCSPGPDQAPAPVPDSELLERARRLDTEHRTATGRPISRDTLRGQLRIARDRASALVTIIRAETDPVNQEAA